MRQAGTIADQTQAFRLADYLFTKGIITKVEPEGDRFAVWIRDEEHVDEAKAELTKFLADPDNPVYRSATTTAREKRQVLEKQQQRASRNVIDMRQRWRPVALRMAPVTIALLAISVLVALATRFGDARSPDDGRSYTIQSNLYFNNHEPVVKFGQPVDTDWMNCASIRQGEWWRVITPIFLHFGIFHLAFNMFMLRDFGALVETRIGSWKYVVLVLVLAVISNCGQAMWNDYEVILGRFGGMSGVLYGLFGFAWMKSRFDPAAGIMIPQNLVVLLMIWFFLCLFGIISNVANAAHAAGLIAGVVIGYFPVLLRKVLP
ncbi:MAG: rhomboid family intramembrane serine protease [Planctomycetota bacterium]|nr:rhomboid family intramembrane serine protease [Planctomycetota bacterium]